MLAIVSEQLLAFQQEVVGGIYCVRIRLPVYFLRGKLIWSAELFLIKVKNYLNEQTVGFWYGRCGQRPRAASHLDLGFSCKVFNRRRRRRMEETWKLIPEDLRETCWTLGLDVGIIVCGSVCFTIRTGSEPDPFLWLLSLMALRRPSTQLSQPMWLCDSPQSCGSWGASCWFPPRSKVRAAEETKLLHMLQEFAAACDLMSVAAGQQEKYQAEFGSHVSAAPSRDLNPQPSSSNWELQEFRFFSSHQELWRWLTDNSSWERRRGSDRRHAGKSAAAFQ